MTTTTFFVLVLVTLVLLLVPMGLVICHLSLWLPRHRHGCCGLWGSCCCCCCRGGVTLLLHRTYRISLVYWKLYVCGLNNYPVMLNNMKTSFGTFSSGHLIFWISLDVSSGSCIFWPWGWTDCLNIWKMCCEFRHSSYCTYTEIENRFFAHNMILTNVIFFTGILDSGRSRCSCVSSCLKWIKQWSLYTASQSIALS